MNITGFNKIRDFLKHHHRNNTEKGVYSYMWGTALKIVFIYLITVVPVILLLKRYVDLSSVFNYITNNYSDPFVLIIFLVSETLLGMIPPDLFVIWAGKFSAPFMSLLVMGVLSYVGGILSYFIGTWLSKRRKIKEYSERVLEKYIKMVRKWGGAFIVIAALFPYSPFSMVVIAVSLMKYPFKLYLIFGLSRILRFIIQGIFYLHILNIDKMF